MDVVNAALYAKMSNAMEIAGFFSGMITKIGVTIGAMTSSGNAMTNANAMKKNAPLKKPGLTSVTSVISTANFGVIR